MRVLLADDDEAFRGVVAEYLAAHGIEIIQAGDGVAAMHHVTRSRLGSVPLDAAVLDLNMPRLGGIEALRRIRDADSSLTVIVASAATEPALLRQAHALGAHAVFQKPVLLPTLLAALQGHFASVRTGDLPAPTAGVPRPAPLPAATRVLVVDDDAAVRDMLVDFLEMGGYRTRSAGDAASAIRALVEEPADVALLDIGLPGLNGADALPSIRAVAPRTSVIMVSGNVDRELAKRTLARGAFDYLVKPINLRYLAQSLEMALVMNAMHDEILLPRHDTGA